MSIAVPTNCTNSECGKPSIRAIHRSAQPVAIDAIDGPPVCAYVVTYRCTQCGHTWAVHGHCPGNDVRTAREANGVTAATGTHSHLG